MTASAEVSAGCLEAWRTKDKRKDHFGWVCGFEVLQDTHPFLDVSDNTRHLRQLLSQEGVPCFSTSFSLLLAWKTPESPRFHGRSPFHPRLPVLQGKS